MPYKVLTVDDFTPVGDTVGESLEAGLNDLERQGFSLVGVVPQFSQPFNEDRDILRPPMLVFHKHPGQEAKERFLASE